MPITKRIGQTVMKWNIRLLIVVFGFSLSACQTSAISPQDSSNTSQGAEQETTGEAIADSPSPPLSPSAFPQNVPLTDGTPPPNKPLLSTTTPGTTLSTGSRGADQSAASGLAKHLTTMGAQMFGAYWCPHCQEQKRAFGDAFSDVDYVECDPGGENPRTQRCLDKDIEAFPTWIINGEQHVGAYSLEELAELSGYGG